MKKILVITGEESGDKQFSLFWKELSPFLKNRYELWGIGGVYFKEIGGKIIFDQNKLSVMGVTEVFSKIGNILNARRKITNHVYLNDTVLAVLVDFPDFNFRVGKELKKRGVPVAYFIPPKVWAWRRSRVRIMKGFVDYVFYIFPFENKIYDSAGIKNLFVGNPAVREMKRRISKAEGEGLLLFPGSREFEVKNLLPVMLKSAKVLKSLGYNLPITISLAKTTVSLVKEIIYDSDICFDIEFEEELYSIFSKGKIAVAASGTVNLELAVAGIPQIVIYRVSPLTFEIGKRLVKLNYVSPVNILAGEMLVPELLQDRCNEKYIVDEVVNLLESTEYFRKIQESYRRVIKMVADEADLKEAAKVIEGMVQ